MFEAFIRIIGVLIGMFAAATNASAATKDWPSFVSKLEASGYFEGMPSGKAEELRESILKNGWTRRHTFDGTKMVAADAEAIAEGGFFDLAAELQPLIASYGVAPITGDQNADQAGYWVEIEGAKHFLYTSAEFKAERAGKPGFCWGLASTRALKLVNERLSAAGAVHRAYAINGGEELIVAILTPAQAKLIAAEVEPLARPYEMIEAYPLFGMPE